MFTTRRKLINAAYVRAAFIDSDIRGDIHRQYESAQRTILADKSLIEYEITEVMEKISRFYEKNRLINNSGTKRICENCQSKCLAISFCEHCVRNHLKSNFSNWKSGNDDLDDLIRNCQMEMI